MLTKLLSGIFLILSVLTISCNRTEKNIPDTSDKSMVKNLLDEVAANDRSGLKWMNKPKSFELNNGKLNVIAEKGTDFFNSPEDGTITATAPLLYKLIEGDFIARALVRPDFSSMWNAIALMVHIDNNNWIKFAFENSDATGRSIVSVVTRDASDDANGVILENQDQVWLKLIRKDNTYSMHWSIDGKDYKMARLSKMSAVDTVKVGLEVQCPVGDSAIHEIEFFEIEQRTVRDIRKGD